MRNAIEIARNCRLPLFLMGVLASGLQPAFAQPAGHFMRTGDMTTERAGHIATLLADGKVLIFGGGSATAELYDPSTGTFAPTGGATSAGYGQTATRLTDGRVLIVPGDRLDRAALYDPDSGTFIPSANMVKPQQLYAAASLPDGKVLVAGESHAELYDPATGKFALAGPYAVSGAAFTAPFTFDLVSNALPQGRVLLTGDGLPEIYDSATDTFALAGNGGAAYSFVRSIVEWQASTTLKDGTVLISGGNDDDTCDGFNVAEIYDPSTDSFVWAGYMTAQRDIHSSTLLYDGTVLIAGGGAGWCFTDTRATAELYVPAKHAFVSVGKMIHPRSGQTATLLNDGRVLVAGGFSYWPFSVTRTAELYGGPPPPPPSRRRATQPH